MTISVLAVDDSKTMRDMIRVALDSEDFEVSLAEDGQEGLDLISDKTPDVVLTDINMPRLDGFALIDALRRRAETRRVPIIVLTTESAPNLRERARQAGATGWIVKPFVPEKLTRALRMVAG